MRLRSFRHKGLKHLYETGDHRGVPAQYVAKLTDIIHAMEQARNLRQIGLFPGWRLHRLKGKRRSEWSVWVTGNFRLTFRVVGDDVWDIDFEDYHGK